MPPHPALPQPSRRALSAGAAVLFALLTLGATHLAVRAWLQVRDTPAHHPEWIDDGLGLAERGHLPRPANIRGGHLRVGEGAGLEGVRWREPLNLRSIEFSVLCLADRHVDLWFGDELHSRLGIRLSRQDRLPSAWWIDAEDGAASSLRAFYPSRLVGWQRVRVAFEDDGSFAVAIGGHEVLQARGPLPAPRTFGFRGGGGGALIDDVRLETRAGAVTRVDFSNHQREGLAYVLGLLAVLSLCGAARAFGSSSTLVASVVPALLIGGGAIVVRQVDSARGERDVTHTEPVAVRGAALSDALSAEFAEPGPPGARILFLGTGLTQGSGASDPRRGWVPLVCAGLNGPLAASDAAIECVNAGLLGASNAQLWKLYRDQWSKLSPDVVIASLGHEDADPDTLKVSAERLVEFNKERGVVTWFVLEPTPPENRPPASGTRDEVLRVVSREHGLAPPSDLKGVFGEGSRDRHLWWALGSPTDEGHALIAEQVLSDGVSLGAFTRGQAPEREQAPGQAPEREQAPRR